MDGFTDVRQIRRCRQEEILQIFKVFLDLFLIVALVNY
jgi:hypothetical protein